VNYLFVEVDSTRIGVVVVLVKGCYPCFLHSTTLLVYLSYAGLNVKLEGFAHLLVIIVFVIIKKF
jgi:hypothetical protein